MADKKSDLRKLRRVELLELLVEVGKENDRLKEELQLAQEALDDRALKIEGAGSMAEAALALNEVFAAADAACAQWVESVQARGGEALFSYEPLNQPNEETVVDAHAWADDIIAEAQFCADDILNGAYAEAQDIISQAEYQAKVILRKAHRRSREALDTARALAESLLDEAEAILNEANNVRLNEWDGK